MKKIIVNRNPRRQDRHPLIQGGKMVNRKLKRGVGLDSIQQKYGYTFVAHWAVGMILFFIVPLLTSVWYAFCNVSITAEGIVAKFAGLANFKKALFEDIYYSDHLIGSVTSLAYRLPIIVSLSLILAVLLNQKFPGRAIARAVFFLPLIIGFSPIMSRLTGEQVQMLGHITEGVEGGAVEMINFHEILAGLNLPSQIDGILSYYLSRVTSLFWSCSIQTILFLAGLQSIPESAYEAGRVEGANAWMSFWTITVPMLGRIISLVIVYTMIDLFSSGNAVVSYAYNIMNRHFYDLSSAILWFYFVIVTVIIGAVLALYNKFCMKRWE